MSAATSEGTGRVYGVRRGELARSTWYAQAAATRPDRAPPAKRGPKTALSDEALVAAIRAVHAAARATRWEALEPIRQGVRERFGRIGAKVASGLRLRHDHGTQYRPTISSRSSRSWGLRRARRLSAPRRATGAPSG